MEPAITWFAQSAFRVEFGGQRIYVDPFKLPDSEPPADILLLSHDHGDHLSPADIEKIRNDHTVVVAGPAVTDKIEQPFTELAPGERTEIANVSIRAVPAYTVTKLRDSGEATHPKDARHVGFILEIEGVSFYFAGDTDVIPEMDSIGPVDYAFLPVSGVYVMTAEEAADAARIVQPSVAIPCHYGAVVGSRADAEQFAELVPDQVRVWILEPSGAS